MKINFLLPVISSVPVGGLKVVYEYSNKMASDGIEVSIIYPMVLRFDKAAKNSFFLTLRMKRKVIIKKIIKKYFRRVWFKLNPSVREILVPCLKEKFIPEADITFATAWETAEWLNTYSSEKGKKMYLIQAYEDWSGTKEQVDATWKMPFQKIVITRWLKEYATSLKQHSVIVHNGLDFNMYFINHPIEKRNSNQLIMLNHYASGKGSEDGISAVVLAKERNPAIELILFGTKPRPKNIPSWIEYHQKPSNLKDLYNRAAIFVSPSWAEGWALPPAEAMQCGCTCVLTDIGGHREYGINNRDLLLVPVKNPVAMAKVINELIDNNSRRIEIAKSGNIAIQQFSWDKSYDKLKQCF